MSKGGGTKNNTTVTNQTTPNPIAQGAYQNAVNTGTNVANTPYTPYNGSLVAGFTPTQQAAFSNIGNAAGLAQPYYSQAADLIRASTSGINPSSTVGQYTNSNLSSQFTDPARQLAATSGQGINPLSGQFGVQNFMNPYTQNVVTSMQALQKQQDAAQQTQLEGQAAGAGAFGGDRAAIMQSTLAGQQDLANNASLANVLQSGYGQALGAAMQTGTTNAQLGLGAGQLYGSLGGLNQGAYNTALQTGLGSQEANAWLASQGAFGMANLGTTAQNSALTGANAQLQAGALQQQLAQEQLNVPYSQFQQARAYPFQTANFQLGLATGSPGGGSSSTTSPGPSYASQLTGLGLTGLGLYNAYNNSGGFGNLFGSSTDPYTVGGLAKDATGGLANAAATDTGWYTPVAHGGRIEARHYDDGGAVLAPLGLGANMPTGGLSAPVEAGLGSGNPMLTQQMQQLNGLPTEKLREMQTRMPPGSPQGNVVSMVLRRRMMAPQNNPAMQGLGTAPLGMEAGGRLPFATAGGVGDEDDTAEQYRLTAGRQGGFSNLTDGVVDQPALPDVPGGSVRPAGLGTPPGTLYGDAGYSSQNWDKPVAEASAASGIPVPVLRGLFQTESSWNPNAVNPKSKATGLGQVLPSTALNPGYPGMSPDPEALTDPKENILFSAKYLAARGRNLFGDKWDPTDQQQMRAALNDYSGGGGKAYADSVLHWADRMDQIDAQGGSTANNVGMRLADTGHMPNGLSAGADPITVGQMDTEESGLGARGSGLSGLNGALIAAGLGMMGGQSPFALSNIGQGGLAGLNYMTRQDQLAAQREDARARLEQTGAYQRGELSNRALTLAQSAQQHADTMRLGQERLAMDRYTYTPWEQPDPNDPNKKITGFMRTPKTGDEPPTFVPAQGVPLNKSGSVGTLFDAQIQSGKTGDEFLQSLPPGEGAAVKSLADGKTAVPGGFATAREPWASRIKAAQAYDPNFDQTTYGTRQRTIKSFLPDGTDGKAITAINNVMPHLAGMSDAFQGVYGGQFKGANAIGNWAADNGLLGKAATAGPAAAREAVQSVASEMRKVFQSSGGGNLTELEEWKNNFPINGSAEAKQAAIQKAFDLMDSRLTTLADSYNRGMALAHPSESVSLLKPDAQKAYQRLTGAEPKSAVTTLGGNASRAAPAAAPAQPGGSSATVPPSAIDFLRKNGVIDGRPNTEVLYQFRQKYGVDPAQYLSSP